MSERIALHDGEREQPNSIVPALATLIVAVFSGPFALTIGYYIVSKSSPNAVAYIGSISAITCASVSIVFSFIVYFRLERSKGARGLGLVSAGVCIAVMWALAIMCLASYLSATLE